MAILFCPFAIRWQRIVDYYGTSQGFIWQTSSGFDRQMENSDSPLGKPTMLVGQSV